MSSSPGPVGQGWPTSLCDLIAATDIECAYRDDDGVLLSLTQELVCTLFPRAPELRVGDLGVMSCFLPLDISLRAYAIDAINDTAEATGLSVYLRRDVPVGTEVLGDGAFTRPHVSQFVILRPATSEPNTFERQLMQLKSDVEAGLAELGLTREEFRVLSCSARAIRYGYIAGKDNVITLYPELLALGTGTSHLLATLVRWTGARFA